MSHWSWKKDRTLVEDRGYATPCWIWQLAKDRNGYGCVRVGSRTDGTRRQEKAHRAFWIDKHGPIPDGMMINHKCQNTDCVNPDHLELVTPAGNLRRDHARCVVNSEVAAQIRAADGSHRAVAERFGVSYEVARRIRVGVRWNPNVKELV